MPFIPGQSHPKRTCAGQRATRQSAVKRLKVGKDYSHTLEAGIARLDACIIEAMQMLEDLRAERGVCVKALKAEIASHPERVKPCSSASWK